MAKAKRLRVQHGVVPKRRAIPPGEEVEEEPKDTKRRIRPATTLEGRENQLIAEAINLAERQIRQGTASSQVMTHFLKLGSTKEKLEKEKLIEENKHLRAKTDSLMSVKRTEELIANALSAMQTYTGQRVKVQKQEVEDDD